MNDNEEKKKEELQKNPKVQRLLEYKKQGIPESIIAKKEDIGMSCAWVNKTTNKCIKLGLVTQQEIEEGRAKYEKEKREANPDRKIILEGLRQGKNYIKISQNTTVDFQQVKKITEQLVTEGIITWEEIEEARKNYKDDTVEEIKSIDKELLLGSLFNGFDFYDFNSKYGKVSSNEYEKLKEELINEERITHAQIKERREERVKEIKEIILQCLQKGMTHKAISETADITERRTETFIKQVKKENNITCEDINNWKSEQENSIANRKNAVLEGLREGLFETEIARKYPKLELSRENVKYYISTLINSGVITVKQIEEYRLLRQERISKLLNESEKEVLKYLMQGYYPKEIAKIKQRCIDWVYRKTLSIKEKGAITDEEIANARLHREEKVRLKQFNNLKREIETEVKFNAMITEEKSEKIREYINIFYILYNGIQASVSEIDFLQNAYTRIQIDSNDIIRFIKFCITQREYKRALDFTKKRKHKASKLKDKTNESDLLMLEKLLERTCNIQYAAELIKKGNRNMEVLKSITKLTNDEINILKIKLSSRAPIFLDIKRREKVIKALENFKDLTGFYKKMEMSDFEIDDIEEQVIHRRGCTNMDEEAKINESRMRIIVLYTKLGKSPETIAKILNIDSESINQNIKNAINIDLIKPCELNGIQLLPFNESIQLEHIL